MSSSLPPNLFDEQTIVSLLSVLALLLISRSISRAVLDEDTPRSLRVLFIWHAFDAAVHFCLEGGFLYHCFFSWTEVADGVKGLEAQGLYPDPEGYLSFLGHGNGNGDGMGTVVHGSQAGGENPVARLWMVYARADRRWGGVDLVG